MTNEGKSSKRISLIFLSLMALFWILPLLWVLSTSLKPESQAIAWPIRWIPETITFQNYVDVLMRQDVPVLRWFWNSFFIATVHTGLMLLFNSMSAYAFARLKFRGREVLFWGLMATMMIPPVMNLVPLYGLISSFGWVNNYSAMIFPGLGGVFGIFLLRQFFIGIPHELEEAARIDGASAFFIYWRIILPLAKPALIVLALFTFMGNWNDYLWPLIVTTSADMRTLPVGLAIMQGQFNIQFAKLMAATILSAIPVIILFMFAQKFIIKGIALTGIKG
ncbi:carbohydrate ABC transporter permease [Evansella cellulosilytica]|uniref:Binding-protein-dependent transport systems inner membrane component n=1 Tax=Evansella cellulosilytica (strain ATCC 21833 / DSM 2522 / FERM P-1141 / JCM 9156 / N-4) TaxID=649639 RepID=E6TQD1_EVAC2|nr:carbohydrate ABC transporter permease [Evansella cellulosilytica]ADU29309.1 binding-protein-dependent transport systems inner membrane component [Evansella cellulosilytica DSM 2522]